ncbi:helix-turn-helix domain-containing protein [Pseudonocardia sp. DR1-2]|uniref:IclR family transcriptional regulator n=1 Tax=Pseudonocardia sp. DR1-2 TaxID=2951168 RepID=UPI002042F799|nr:helix-turn-helix domain-containing protein [Pseudonocardia sp. DR1-2]MCM3850009.1 helix-turn-helix domain-containing protein [Pseudonocardia sp. DR1-2]
MRDTGLLQTLDRGLTILEVLAQARYPLTLADLSARLGVHRSITHRLVRTLQAHHLIARTPTGYVLGTGTTALGRAALPVVQQVAKGEVYHLARRTDLTAFLVVRDGPDVVTLISVDTSSARLNVVYSPGARHPLEVGSPGLAVLAGGEARPDERPEVTRGRAAGYVVTFGEVIEHQGSVAAPIRSAPGRAIGALALTFGHERPGSRQIDALLDSAAVVSARLVQAQLRGAVVPDLDASGDPSGTP